MESSFQNNSTENQWDEVVNDLWSEILPCLRSESKHSHKNLSLLYTTPCISCNVGFTNLPVSSTTGRYGFDGENKEEHADDLYQDLNADISEAAEYSLDSTPPSPSIRLDVAIGEAATVSESDMPRPAPISSIGCGAPISETATFSESDMPRPAPISSIGCGAPISETATLSESDMPRPAPISSIGCGAPISETATFSESDMHRSAPISSISCGASISETAVVSESDMSVRQESEALRQVLEDPDFHEEKIINEKKGRKAMPCTFFGEFLEGHKIIFISDFI